MGQLKEVLPERAIVHDTEEDDDIIWVGEPLPAADAAQIDRELDAVMKSMDRTWG